MPPRDLDDRLLDRKGAAQEVDVPRLEGDELAPPQPGLDKGDHHQPVLVRDRRQQLVELWRAWQPADTGAGQASP